MTQINGVYCSLCRIRYQAHAMDKDNGPICQHHLGYATKRGVIAPAIFIYTYAWRTSDGYRKIVMYSFFYHKVNNHWEWKQKPTMPEFSIKYVNNEDYLNKQFLNFLLDLQTFEWSIWTAAFHSLTIGGSGAQYPPNWRCRQLARRREGEVK